MGPAPNCPFGRSPPSPYRNWRPFPQSLPPPSFPTPWLFSQCSGMGLPRLVWGRVLGPRAQGSGGRGPPSGTWGQTHTWEHSTHALDPDLLTPCTTRLLSKHTCVHPICSKHSHGDLVETLTQKTSTIMGLSVDMLFRDHFRERVRGSPSRFECSALKVLFAESKRAATLKETPSREVLKDSQRLAVHPRLLLWEMLSETLRKSPHTSRELLGRPCPPSCYLFL